MGKVSTRLSQANSMAALRCCGRPPTGRGTRLGAGHSERGRRPVHDHRVHAAPRAAQQPLQRHVQRTARPRARRGVAPAAITCCQMCPKMQACEALMCALLGMRSGGVPLGTCNARCWAARACIRSRHGWSTPCRHGRRLMGFPVYAQSGCFFLDRDGRHFHDVLNFLRVGAALGARLCCPNFITTCGSDEHHCTASMRVMTLRRA